MKNYAFELHPNKEYATLHVSVKLHTELNAVMSCSLKNTVLELKSLTTMLQSIDGLNAVESFGNHSIYIKVSPLFDRSMVLAAAFVVFAAWHGTAVSTWYRKPNVNDNQ